MNKALNPQELHGQELLNQELQAQELQWAELGRALRRKSLREALLLAAGLALVVGLAATPLLAVRNGLLFSAIGIPLFLLRRGMDLRRLAGAARWREQALEGRGVSLREWHSGAATPRWTPHRH